MAQDRLEAIQQQFLGKHAYTDGNAEKGGGGGQRGSTAVQCSADVWLAQRAGHLSAGRNYTARSLRRQMFRHLGNYWCFSSSLPAEMAVVSFSQRRAVSLHPRQRNFVCFSVLGLFPASQCPRQYIGQHNFKITAVLTVLSVGYKRRKALFKSHSSCTTATFLNIQP